MSFQMANRLEALPTYLFVELARRKRAAIAAGRDVIDFGIGDPDLPTPSFIVEQMQSAVAQAENHRYPSDTGSPAFRRAMADFLLQRYGVTLDPDREILALIGSKDGVGHLPMAVLNPGDACLVPEPGYPVYGSATVLAGGVAHAMPLLAERDWKPDFKAIPSDVRKSAKLMYLNYPNNPTGALADLTFFEEAVEFAKANDLLVCHDAAYSDMYWGEPPPSILQVEGAREVAIELHSASKTFCMTGWRIGFAAGHAEALAALAKIKSLVDSSVFTAVQEAAITAYGGINEPERLERIDTYRKRVEILAGGLRDLGFEIGSPQATFYLWAGIPGGGQSMAFASRILDEADVVCVPGAGFGKAGEGYVRFSVTVSSERTQEALERLRKMSW